MSHSLFRGEWEETLVLQPMPNDVIVSLCFGVNLLLLSEP